MSQNGSQIHVTVTIWSLFRVNT